MSTYGLFGLDYMEKILTDEYIILLRDEQHRIRMIAATNAFLWLFSILMMHVLFFYPINRNYQAKKQTMLLITDSVLVSNESIMF